jgi:hypothetical protein
MVKVSRNAMKALPDEEKINSSASCFATIPQIDGRSLSAY